MSGHSSDEAFILNKKQMLKCYIFGAVLVIIDLLLYVFHLKHHATFFWDHIPGFSAIFGFIACVGLIIFSKGIGHAFLMKGEDFYDD